MDIFLWNRVPTKRIYLIIIFPENIRVKYTLMFCSQISRKIVAIVGIHTYKYFKYNNPLEMIIPFCYNNVGT